MIGWIDTKYLLIFIIDYIFKKIGLSNDSFLRKFVSLFSLILLVRFVLNIETDFLSPIFIVVGCLIDTSWKVKGDKHVSCYQRNITKQTSI